MRILIALFAAMLFYACKKSDIKPPYKPMEFDIANLPDSIFMEESDTTEFSFSVVYLSGYAEKAGIQISGLPASVGADFSVSIDTPSFDPVLRLVSHNTATGVYNIIITAADTRQTKTDSFKLVITPGAVNPALPLLGSYIEAGPCSISGNLNDTVRITALLPAFNKVRLTSLWNGNQTTVVDADYDPITQIITIPQQTVNSAIFSGIGIFSGTQINLSYSVDLGFTKDSCSVVLSKF